MPWFAQAHLDAGMNVSRLLPGVRFGVHVVFKKAHFKILADKPELFGVSREHGLSEDSIRELRGIPRLAVADISAFTDFAVFFEVLADARPDALLPVVDYKGTEFGDWQSLWRKISQLKEAAEKKLHVYVPEPVLVGSPRLWRALATHHAGRISRRFGMAGPCNACMLYCFAIRIPLCKHINARYILTDKGRAAAGPCEYLQPGEALRYAAMLLSNFGVTLLRHPGGAREIVPAGFNPGGELLECVLSHARDSRKVPPQQINAYYEHFAIPAAAKTVSRILAGAPVDYSLTAEQSLE